MPRAVLPFILLSALVAASCTPKELPAADPAAPLPVSVARAEMTSVRASFEAGGSVHARFAAPIASRVLAPVVSVHVRAGDRVRRGDPLVVLEQAEFHAHRDRAVAGMTAAQESAAAAAADVVAADASLALARATHQRIADLAEKRSATPQELDQALAALRAAEAQLRGARARQAAAEASTAAARAAASAAETAVSYTTLRAPFDGVVTTRAIDPGGMATPGTPLLTIEDAASVHLEVRLDEARAGLISTGDRVEVTLNEPGTTTPLPTAGHVSEIAGIDPSSHAFLARIELDVPGDGPSRLPRSGAFGTARFALPAQRALTVPTTAVVRRGQLSFVFTIDEDARARLRAVSLGHDADGRVDVHAGVAEGTRVIIDPPAALRDGSRVSAPETASGAQR